MLLSHDGASTGNELKPALLCRLAYPMPPAGADPETWVPEEEPQPIGISVTLPQGSVLPGAFHQHYLTYVFGSFRNMGLSLLSFLQPLHSLD